MCGREGQAGGRGGGVGGFCFFMFRFQSPPPPRFPRSKHRGGGLGGGAAFLAVFLLNARPPLLLTRQRSRGPGERREGARLGSHHKTKKTRFFVPPCPLPLPLPLARNARHRSLSSLPPLPPFPFHPPAPPPRACCGGNARRRPPLGRRHRATRRRSPLFTCGRLLAGRTGRGAGDGRQSQERAQNGRRVVPAAAGQDDGHDLHQAVHADAGQLRDGG